MLKFYIDPDNEKLIRGGYLGPDSCIVCGSWAEAGDLCDALNNRLCGDASPGPDQLAKIQAVLDNLNSVVSDIDALVPSQAPKEWDPRKLTKKQMWESCYQIAMADCLAILAAGLNPEIKQGDDHG